MGLQGGDRDTFHDPKRADRGPCGTDGRPALPPVSTSTSLLAHSSDVRHFDTPLPPKKVKRWLWAVLRLAAACLGQLPVVSPWRSNLTPHPHPCTLRRPLLVSQKRAFAEAFFPACCTNQLCSMVLRSPRRGRVGTIAPPTPHSFCSEGGVCCARSGGG